jgi:hypothetical protein
VRRESKTIKVTIMLAAVQSEVFSDFTLSVAIKAVTINNMQVK